MKLCIRKILFFSMIAVGIVQVSSVIMAMQPAKSIAYKQVQVKTVQEALIFIRRAVSNFPHNAVSTQAYEKEQTGVLLACSKILYDTARTQILEALLEIDNRMTYWQYQKDHPWDYFISKNPLKWVTGQKQEEEIQTNLDTLESHQGELYVLLGQLSVLGNDFNQGYKNTFLADYTKAYAWIDKLLEALIRIKGKALNTSSPFIARAHLVKAKLEHVDQFKNDLLADIPQTAMPGYLTRNWLKSSALLLTLGYGYNKGALAKLQDASTAAMGSFVANVVSPVKGTVNEVLGGGMPGGLDNNALASTRGILLDLTQKFVTDNSKKYGITQAQEKTILAELSVGNYDAFQKFLDVIGSKEAISPSEKSNWSMRKLYQDVQSGVAKLTDLGDFARGQIYFLELLGLNYAVMQQKQWAGIVKFALLTPSILTGWLGYTQYKRLTEKNYSPIRRALVDIKSIFIDASEPLSDEQYGKMLYLIFMLKKQAEKMLPQKDNIRADFIHDLERIELQQVKVAAKRSIVEDMFLKYDFLGLIQNK